MADELKGLKVISFTVGHPCTDGRIYYKEAKSIAGFGASLTILAPNIAAPPRQPRGENIKFKLFDIKKGLKNRLLFGHRIYRALEETPGDIIHCHEPDALTKCGAPIWPNGCRRLFGRAHKKATNFWKAP